MGELFGGPVFLLLFFCYMLTGDFSMATKLIVLLLITFSAYAQNGTQAGRFVIEHPTLLNLGFEWFIEGDANRNATVDVQFRAAG